MEGLKVASVSLVGAVACGAAAVGVHRQRVVSLVVVPFSAFVLRIRGIVVCFVVSGQHTNVWLAHVGAIPVD